MLVVLALALTLNQAPDYAAFEAMVPMRDGVRLHTVVIHPVDAGEPSPILMERTPYGAGTAAQGPRRARGAYADRGYVLVRQDVRGRNRSEGEYVNVRPFGGEVDESTDAYDTVEWLLANVPNHNGRVGLRGVSYPGFYAAAAAISGHPAIVAVSPQAPVNDWFLGDDVHHNGAFFLQETFDFMLFFDVPRGEPPIRLDREGMSAYEFFLAAGAPSGFDEKFLQGRVPYWFELLEHDTYDGYWKDRALWRSFHDVSAAVLTVGGWFDKEDLFGALQLYRAGEAQNPAADNRLVMGPWSHGQWGSHEASSLGDWSFEQATAPWYRQNVEVPFFERHLRRVEARELAEATVFETGANAWREFDLWPPAEAEPESLFLLPRGQLSETPAEESGTRSFVSDPAAPTPYVADWPTSTRAPSDWLARDQRFLAERDDQLTYVGEPLSSPFRVAGPIEVDLWIETTGTDGDLVVQVIDASPDGTERMVRGDIFRMKFRESFEDPKPLRPGEPTRIRFDLNDVMHTFLPGHRIRVRVMGSWFPIADRNPNTFVSRAEATDEDYVAATISVLSGRESRSRIVFGVMPPP